jgi:hypothetical protein
MEGDVIKLECGVHAVDHSDVAPGAEPRDSSVLSRRSAGAASTGTSRGPQCD